MVPLAAEKAKQTLRLPFAAAAAAAQVAASFYTSHFGKSRPGAACGTISCRPALRYRWLPAAVAGVQKRHGIKRRNGGKRVRDRCRGRRPSRFSPAPFSHKAASKSAGIQASFSRGLERRHFRRAAARPPFVGGVATSGERLPISAVIVTPARSGASVARDSAREGT